MSATLEQLELPIQGMTCASCASRIERKLNKLDGVRATVNYATEKARVEFDADAVTPEALVAAVEAVGYSATLPSAEQENGAPDEVDETLPLRNRLIVSAVLSLPLLLISMIPQLQFNHWQWLALQLATPVVVWAAWPFHRAAWANLKHAAATMDTLVSLGVIAAYLWSLYALFLGDAGADNMRMSFTLIPKVGGGSNEI
jgi:Cu+-exporting ATPase